MKHAPIAIAFACVLLCLPPSTAAQANEPRFELGGQVADVTSTEFDSTDIGFGGWFSWHAAPYLGAEAEMSFYPKKLANNGGPAFSRRRIEGLFGVTIGPVFGRVRPYARLRPGFVKFEQAPEPIACLTIYPPILSCALAAGKTMFATDLGGGVEVHAAPRTVVRFDAGDRMVKYPGPVIDSDGVVQESEFFGHDFRFSVGAGVRF